MIVILRHTIMNQQNLLKVFMMFQIMSMLVYHLLKLELCSNPYCATWYNRFEASPENIKMQACEVYNINKMKAKDDYVYI